jgi:3-methyladenine DNA glycosylase/8-oxoguanine DNA glycosylase
VKFPNSIKARRHLSEVDLKLAQVITEVGPIQIELDPAETVFESLATSIVYQQLHGKAASAILTRFKTLCGDSAFPSPKKVLHHPEESLRTTGLSRNKIRALKDLAEKTLAGIVPQRELAIQLSDDALIQALVQVHGIGPWTAHMMMIFTLGRTDVLPVGDYGVRKGFAAVYGKKTLPSPTQLEAAAEKWRPFRSAACWYLWEALKLSRFGGSP